MPNNVKTAERLTRHFTTLDDILADAEKTTAAPHRVTGNWTAAQIIYHVAQAIDMANHGYDLKIPLPMKLFGRTLKLIGAHLKTINPGINPPAKVAAAFAPPADVTMEDAMQKLREAIAYAKEHGMNHPSPLFGKIPSDQWITVHCRHAELHFSFIIPEQATQN